MPRIRLLVPADCLHSDVIARYMETMSYLKAAIAVLAAVRRPLTTRELTQEVLARGLVRPQSKTPEASMSAALYVHLAEVGTAARVVRVASLGNKRAKRGSVRWALAADHI